jgi:Ca2+-binding EF-hand superfamily protein
MEKTENTMAGRRDAANKAVMAFKVFDKDNDGYITKEEFQKISKKLSKEQVNILFFSSSLMVMRNELEQGSLTEGKAQYG